MRISGGLDYYANVGYHTSRGGAAASNGSVLVAKSTNGGATYALPALVHKGFGNLGTSVFDDREWRVLVPSWATVRIWVCPPVPCCAVEVRLIYVLALGVSGPVSPLTPMFREAR